MPPHKVSAYLADEAMDWIRRMLLRAHERYGQPATDAAIIRACVGVAQLHPDEVLTTLGDDLGYGRRGAPNGG